HGGRNRWTSDAFKNFNQISVSVQDHLKKVYLTLCCALVASVAGAYFHLLWNIGGFLTTVGFLGSIIWLFTVPVYEEKKRMSLLMAAGLFEGACLGPLIELAIDIDSSILVSAFVGSALAFGCFSMAAMVARRREYLYLGGALASALSILTWLQFASAVFGGPMALFKFEIYFGLLLFVGYVVFDTQYIIEKAHAGDMDYVRHAIMLYTDFVAIFVRVLVIMLRNASDKEEDKRRKNKR
ncbi:bax inhibitor 1, partial [Genlisea aurea]